VNPPPDERPMPAKVIGDASDWETVEEPVGYGYAARAHYGKQHPRWNDQLDSTLRTEWTSLETRAGKTWDDVKGSVRHGYEYSDRTSQETTLNAVVPKETAARR
jgi:hypothetical protein